MKQKLLPILLLLLANPWFAAAEESEKPVIYVPVPPYVFLFEQLAGEWVDVRAIVGKGDDPHEYSPTPGQLVKLSSSRMICSGELGFEANFFVKVGDGENAPEEFSLLDGLELLEGFCDHPSHRKDASGDSAGREKEEEHHDHEDLHDPHVWLSPRMMAELAERAAAKLVEVVPSREREIGKNLAVFRKRLLGLDKELRVILEESADRKFYVYHGAFAYFARDFGLEQIAVELGNRRPTPKAVAQLAKRAKEDGVTTIFAQPQFDKSSAKALAEAIGGEVATLDPLEEDVFANLRRIAGAIAGREVLSN